jgi:hypothetical protein
LEVAHHRRLFEQYTPPGWTTDAFMAAAIRWLEMPLDQQRADMPNYTESERREMNSWLPALRRARWARR